MEKIIFNLKYKSISNRPAVIALGKFETLHLGHQKLLQAAKNYANKFDYDFIIMLYPLNNRDDKLVITETERLMLLQQYQPNYLLYFEPSVKNYTLTREDFLLHLTKKLSVNTIFVGENFNFGKNKSDDFSLIKQYCDLKVINLVKINKQIISSTLIKHFLEFGFIEEAKSCLGYNWFFSGKVIHGNGNGRKLGYPTLNINVDDNKFHPKFGAYVAYAIIGNKRYPAMCSIMSNSKFDSNSNLVEPITFEVHLFGFSEELVEETVYVELLTFIHSKQNWSSIIEGRKNLAIDEQFSKNYFNNQK